LQKKFECWNLIMKRENANELGPSSDR
jgi:hypothetical protein